MHRLLAPPLARTAKSAMFLCVTTTVSEPAPGVEFDLPHTCCLPLALVRAGFIEAGRGPLVSAFPLLEQLRDALREPIQRQLCRFSACQTK